MVLIQCKQAIELSSFCIILSQVNSLSYPGFIELTCLEKKWSCFNADCYVITDSKIHSQLLFNLSKKIFSHRVRPLELHKLHDCEIKPAFMLWCTHTGKNWNFLPQDLCSSVTISAHFLRWVKFPEVQDRAYYLVVSLAHILQLQDMCTTDNRIVCPVLYFRKFQFFSCEQNKWKKHW